MIVLLYYWIFLIFSSLNVMECTKIFTSIFFLANAIYQLMTIMPNPTLLSFYYECFNFIKHILHILV